MILTCPECGTQYVVKDGAIPPGGRQVRCASCKHSWHQDPEEGAHPTETPEAPTEAVSDEAAATDYDQVPADDGAGENEEESFTEATLMDPSSGPAAEERAYEESLMADETGTPPAAAPAEQAPYEQAAAPAAPLAADVNRVESAPADWREPPQGEPQDDEFSPFPTASDDIEAGRRSPLMTVLLVVILVAALAAAFWFFAPDAWKVRLGLAAAGASPLALVTTHMDRQRLASGQETLNVTGRVINNTGKDQDVPPLQAQLRARGGKLVYQWTIAPPAATLPPGGSASFNSTEVSVPPGGDELTISVGAPRA